MAKTVLKNQPINMYLRQAVLEAIREIFNDPDYGLPLTPQTIQRLKKSRGLKTAGRLIDFEEILKEYHK